MSPEISQCQFHTSYSELDQKELFEDVNIKGPDWLPLLCLRGAGAT